MKVDVKMKAGEILSDLRSLLSFLKENIFDERVDSLLSKVSDSVEEMKKIISDFLSTGGSVDDEILKVFQDIEDTYIEIVNFLENDKRVTFARIRALEDLKKML